MKAAVKNKRPPKRVGKGGRPTKAREGEISDQILATAGAMFANQGYAATSVEQVALACAAGKDTIYRRYPSKRALFDAVVERLRIKVLERLDDVVLAEKGEPRTQLERIARWFLTINLDPELVALRRIAFTEAGLKTESSSPAAGDPIFQRLVDIVAASQAAGILQAGDPTFIAMQLINAVVVGPTNEAMLGRSTYASTADQDAYFEKAWALFMSGAQPR
ncbi:TetR/AcrR family transcriptional regulator [Methylocella sp. CPCC 101449]|uniref:TetR/AcrR family transcriptional regulator n=1 Tax=Methylocella sp. CPCC 101449 TaxID=2987531 RepID=UPI002891C08D|nr:TetR/AcrR family transcriptional regulator [Methylocella sp. CPCC 101449]MDT2022527.1 TetR/AcrR family transcriptional regulator [Methylocella sp. CPCC 101449]